MADISYYTKKKEESDREIQEALKARKNRPSAGSQVKASQDNAIQEALDARERRIMGQVDNTFLDTFFADTKNFFAQYEKDYDNRTWQSKTDMGNKQQGRYDTWNDIKYRASIVRSWANANKSNIGDEDYNELISYLNGVTSNGSIVLQNFGDLGRYYSQWDSEDNWIKGATENWEWRQQRYEDNKKRIEELKAQRDNLIPQVTFNPDSNVPLPFFDQGYLSQRRQYNDEIERLEAENAQYKRGEGGWATKSSDDHYDVTQADDFGITSANRNYTNPTREQIEVADVMNDSSTWKWDDANGVYRDAYGNELAVDDTNTYYNPKAQETQVVDKLGLYLNTSEDERVDAAMNTGGMREGIWTSVMREGYTGSWQYLNETELGIYYTYLGESQEKAYQYLEDMRLELNRRQTLDEIGQWYGDYEEAAFLEKIAMNVATFPAQLLSGVGGTVANVVDTLQGEEINPYSTAYSGMHYSQTVRGATAEDLTEIGSKIPVWKEINDFYSLGDVYQSGMSIGDSFLAIGIGGTAGGAILASSAAQSEAYRLYQQGASASQIAFGSTAAFAAELIFESVSIGELNKIKKMASPKTFGQFVKTVLVQGGVEASEEVFTEIANIVTNAFIMASQSDWAASVEENGGNIGKAFLDKTLDVLHAGISGLISGVGSGTVVGGGAYLGQRSQLARTGRTIMGAYGGAEALHDLAYKVADASDGKMAKTLKKQADNISGEVATGKGLKKIGAAIKNNRNATRIGLLYDTVKTANNLANASANQADIAKSLQRKGFNEETANDLAAALVAQYNGEVLTKAQEKLLKSMKDSPEVMKVVSDIIDNVQSTMGQRSQNIRDFQEDVETGHTLNAFARQIASKEFTPKGELTVSKDGKAHILETDEEIDIKGVAEIKDGEVLLDIGDGKTISAKEVSFASEDIALVYEAVANLGDKIDAETANKFISRYDGGNALAFAKGMTQAYSYGFYGYDRSEMAGKKTMSGVLSAKQRNYAYGLGEQYRRVKDQKDKENAHTGKAPAERGVFYRDKDGNDTDIGEYMKKAGSTLNKRQRTAIGVMRRFSEMMGVRFHVFEIWTENGQTYYLNQDGKKTKGNPNGFYDQRTGEIYIALDAGAVSKNGFRDTMLFTIAHELTHYMKQWSPEHFTRISKIVFSQAGFKGNVAALVAKKIADRKNTISYETAVEEVVADAMETILKDGKVVEFMAEVKKQDYTAWQKLKSWFRKLKKFLLKLVDAYKDEHANTYEGRMVADFAEDTLRQIQRIWAEGAVAAGDRYQGIPTTEAKTVSTEATPAKAADTAAADIRKTTGGTQVAEVASTSGLTKAAEFDGSLEEYIVSLIGDVEPLRELIQMDSELFKSPTYRNAFDSYMAQYNTYKNYAWETKWDYMSYDSRTMAIIHAMGKGHEAYSEEVKRREAVFKPFEPSTEVVAVEEGTKYSYRSLAEAAGFVAVENADGTRSFTRNGAKVTKVTVEDIENSPIGAFINYSLEKNDISKADAKRQKEMFADICTMACKTNDFSMTMQFVGSAVFTGMKANADKQYGTTYDFPSICTKTQAVIDAMSAKMVKLGRGLNSDEIVQLYQDVFASGNPVPCPECYVFSRWIGIGGLLDNIKKYQDYYGSMDVADVAKAYLKMKAEVSKFAEEQGISFGKAKGALTSKLTKEYNKLKEKIEKAQNQGEKVKPADLKRLAELEPMMNTVKGMTWLENVYFADSSLKKVNPRFRVPDSVLFDLNNGEAFATQYKEAWAFRTTQGAGYGKAITPYAEAKLGEGILTTNNTTKTIKSKAGGTLDNYFLSQMGKLDKKAKAALDRARLKQKIQAFIGGQRFQSTSDARYENASDYLLAALEMQAMGGMVQVYTKVDGAVPAFSKWGFSINQSLMPLGGGLDANGNVKDTGVGGMNPDVAFENRKKHESAGTITIGVNDNHIRAMFKQWVRDFIIPYHASGGKADIVAAFRSIQEGQKKRGKMVRSTDYSRTQSDKVLSDEVLRWMGKTDAEIKRIHQVRDARIAILTGGKPNMDVVRSNRFLSDLYDKLHGGEWDGVKLAKSKVESQIFPNEFWDQTVTYEQSGKITRDYLEYCDDLGFLHRFSGMIPSNGKLVPVNGYDENGNRVQLTDLAYQYDENGQKTDQVEDFFWKVLTDRRMYDNEGNYLPQKVVTLNDTTTDTVTGFAKNNVGKEYNKETSDRLVKQITDGESDIMLSERDEEAYKQFAGKVNSVINQSITGKGNIDGKVQVVDIMPVGPKLAAMVAKASGYAIDISQRSIALNTSDVWHEYKRHTSVSDEVSRNQIAFTKRQFQNAVKCMISPDMVETIFADTNNPTQRQSFAYAKKTKRGHYVVVEAVGGKKNPFIYPVMIVQFTKAKWNKMMAEGKSLGEILHDGETQKLLAQNVEENKKSRVTAAQFASYEAIANTLRSPQLDDMVSQPDGNVKRSERDDAAEFSDADVKYSIREEAPPKKVGVAYKVFLAKDGELYPPMVANPNGEGTPVGVWLNADIGKAAAPSKTGRPQVQGGGKGTNSGKISLAFRPGWHLGDIPLAKQFAKLNPETGKKELFPANFVWAECEYAMDVDYQEEAMSYGYTENGKFRHSYAGLPKLPADGYYRYRTNPNPDTVPWVITGAMRVKRILTDAETDAICRENGVEPMARQGGPINLANFGLSAGDTTGIKRSERDEAPAFYSQMAKVVDGMKQEKLGAASVVSMLRGKGVKAEEIKWSGIEAWLEGKKSVTKAELQEFIAGSMLQIGEQTSGDSVYWGKYKLDGGENYREIVFTLPNSSYSNQMMRTHWGEDAEGILAHARIQDFIANGKKMLFIEEIQSDWHNEGHQSGYAGSNMDAEIDKLKSVADERFLAVEDYSTEITGLAGEWEAIEKTEKGARLLREYREAQAAYDNAMNEYVKKVPDAPFRDTYHEYVLKRLIRMAAEQGYDSIGWTTADIQSERWSEEYAEGYRIEYDQDIPKFLRKYGKKWGATVSKTSIDTTSIDEKDREMEALGYIDIIRNYTEVWQMDVTDAMKESVMTEGQPLYQEREEDSFSDRALLAGALEELVRSPKERELIDQYQRNISKMEEVQERLRKLRAEIRKLTNAKGDKAKITQMSETAKELADLIDRYDRELLKLQATKPLRDVLARARSAAYQKAKKSSEKALKEYQQQVSERFDRGVEGRRKTEMRKKIRKVIRDLDKILNRGDKKRNVKEDMKDFVAEALSAAEVLFTDNYTNEDMLRNGFGVELSEEEARYAKEAQDILEEIAALPFGNYEAMQARQEAEEKLRSKLAYRMSKLKDAFFRERQRLNKTEVAEVLGKLADAYAKLETSEYAYVNGAYHEAVYQYLKMLQEDVGGAKVKDMTLGQLQDLYKAYTMVLTTVQNANRMFADDLKQSKEELANRVMMEVYEAGGEHGLWTKGQLARNQASWNNTKPIYAAERTGSSTFVKLVMGLFRGQYKWATDMEEAKAFRQKVAEKYGFKSWDMEKTYKFTSSSGIEFELNLNQIMALYAYAKREQAHDHLLKGGFVFGKNTEVVVTKNGIKRTYLNKSAKAHNISDEIMDEIVSTLTKEQRGFVDEMQDYLSTTMGNKGNEVSMRLYGVKLFMEQFYFPLRSAGQFKEKAKEAEMKQQQGQISIANSGFTHATTPKASNPVVLDGFTDVWASHVNEMSLYHSMVLPMEDFRRVYNYASPNMEGQESASVNSFIENAYGDAATGYFDQLYKELNGGAIVDPRENLSKQMIGRFKKSAVMLSNSVWVQQFSAIGRAYALIDPKHFIGAKVDKQKSAAAWEELKQYAPVAIIKEMGGFDTHTGLSAKDYLLAEEYGKGERVKGFFKDEQYRDEIMGLLPAKADQLTWCAIWEAVKRETKAQNPGMDVKSEAFLKKAGERFSEVIEKTQVYDSVLARSANMRSKNGLMQMLTAFMAEPTTTVNMVEDSRRKGNKKTIARTFGAVAASIILNNALVSIIYAMRDDDEDETFLEKYFQAFTSGMLDDINPMTYYPILKDIWSVFQGYDVERSDMAIYSDIADSVKKVVTLLANYDSDMDEDDAAKYHKQIGDALMSLLDAGAAAFGVPLKNARRDLMSYYNTFKTLTGGKSTTWNSFVDAIGGAALDTIPVVGWVAGKSKTDELYDAIVRGDTAYVERLRGGYKDETAYNIAVRKALRENDPRIHEAAVARMNGDLGTYTRIAKEIIAEGHFSQDYVVAAINAEINAIDKGESTTTSAPKASGLYKAEDFAIAISQGNAAMANAIKADIINTAQKNGKTAEEAEKGFVSSATSACKELFLSGDISENQAIDALVTYCDKTEDDAMADVQYWAFKQDYPEVYADDQWFDTYYEKIADSGLPIDVYMDYRNTVSTITGEGKKEKRLAVINSLPITSAQKDALYFAEGWAESKLYEAPWH